MKRTVLVLFSIILITGSCSNQTKINKEEQELEIIDNTIFCVDTIIRENKRHLDIDLGESLGTWYRLEIRDRDTIIYNYPNNAEEGLITPESYKITKDSLIITYFTDSPMSYAIDTAWIEDRVFYFPVGNKYSFKLINKESRIGQWIDYYGREHWNDTLSVSLCIDSAYNKFQIIDYVESSSDEYSMDD